MSSSNSFAKENLKTLILAGVAVGFLLLNSAVGWLRAPKAVPETDDLSTPLVDGRIDPLSATALEIVKYDSAVNEAKVFKVALVDNIWSLPSHDNYPIDNEAHPLASAASSLIGLKKVGWVSNDRKSHAEYEVVEPTPDKSQAGQTGIGMRVILSGKDGKPLASLIIGKAIKDRTDLHYVRIPGRDRVYTAKIDPGKFTTKFEDWINPDLLKTSTFDITKVSVDDYSVDITQQAVVPRGKFELDYNDSAPDHKWKLNDLKAGETLNEKKLNDMTSALTQLRIVDVHPKPPGVGGELTLPDGTKLSESEINALAARGFYMARGQEVGTFALFSNQGEMRIRTKEGVEYTLRFGAVAATDEGAGPNADPEAHQGTNRFLLITTRFDDSTFPKPKLEPLPGDDSQAGYNPADLRRLSKEVLETEEDLKSKRELVELQNKQKQEAYDQQVKVGKDKAEQLSKRFARWYYVISEDLFKKIHLSRNDVLNQPAEPPKEGTPTPGTPTPGNPPEGTSKPETPKKGTAGTEEKGN